jgi:hypothetical protein
VTTPEEIELMFRKEIEIRGCKPKSEAIEEKQNNDD